MKIKDGFVKCKIGEKFLVVTTGELSHKNNIMIELNTTSSEMWDALAKGLSVEEVAKEIAARYEIPFEKALSDTQKLVDNMQKAGIFETE